MRIHNLKKYKNIRKVLRKNLTKAEAVLWSEIQNSKLPARREGGGYKFRRQHSIGPYIVDFYCPKLKLVIELDGGTHDIDEVCKKDEEKQKYLENLNFTVKRYNNEEILNELEPVYMDLLYTCESLAKKSMNYTWKTLGHQPIINFLEKSIANQKLSHAYLFYGPSGIGKHHLALRFAQILQCQSEKGRPCGHCIHCQQIKKSIHPDVYSVEKEEGKKNIAIEQIRELTRKLSLNSFTNSYKIAIIEKAQELSRESWDALLKTLEEPAKKTIIILITNQIKQIPETIISRSQVLKFNTTPTQNIANYLEKELKIEKEQAQTLANLSFGRLGQAIKFIENPQSFIDYKNKAKEFLQILDSNFASNTKLIESYIPQKIEFLEKIQIYQNTLQIWELLIRDLTLVKLNNQNLTNSFLKPELEKLQSNFTINKLKNILTQIQKTKEYLAKNITPKLAMENLLLHIN